MSQAAMIMNERRVSITRRNLIRRKGLNYLFLGITGIMAMLAVVPLFWIIIYVVMQGGKYINLDFFFQYPKPLGMEGSGVWHAIQGTVILSILAGLFAIPPGLLAAFYVARHPNTFLGTAVRFGTDVLSGIPSIVIGLFSYALVVSRDGFGVGYSALAGGVALAIMMLPSIIRTTEEMIKLVPASLREASLGVGATEWRTSLQVILPAARNGVVTGFILGLARAAGETAPLLFTAFGNDRFDLARIVSNGLAQGQNPLQITWRVLTNPVDSLPLTLFKYAQLPSPERVNQAWAAALVLMAIVLFVNIIVRIYITISTARLKG